MTLRIRSAAPDEDGNRAGVEVDMTVAQLRDFAQDCQQAARWVEAGVWKAVPSAK